jgi:tetratricopeptide (TPR) repeat protein
MVDLGDYAKAIRYLQQAVAIAQETKERGHEGWALSGLGYIFYQQGNFANSEKTLVEGMKVLESFEKHRTSLQRPNPK